MRSPLLFLALLVGALAQTTTPPPTCDEITWFMRNWWVMLIIGAGGGLVIGVVATALIMRRNAGYHAVPAEPAQASNMRPVIPAVITAPMRGAVYMSHA